MIPFGEFAPDRAAQSGAARVASGVYPVADGYAPIPALETGPDTGSERVQGGFATKTKAGSPVLFAATATKLYSTTSPSAWTDRSGTTYAAAAESFWSFEKFGSYVLATNGVDPIQYYDTESPGNFGDLAGSPPTASFMCVVKDQLVLGYAGGDAFTVQWSGLNDATNWTTNLADSQVFDSGGRIQGITGGEYGLVFQEFAIRRMTFTGGSTIYQFDVIEENHGLYAPGALAKYGRLNFYLSNDGFYMCDGATATPIGDQKIDRYFFADLDKAYKNRICCAIDPVKKLAIWAYPSIYNINGICDKMLIYHWGLGRWSTSPISTSFIMPAYTLGMGLDSLDSAYPSIDAMTVSFDDDRFNGGKLLLAAFDENGVYNTFTGENIAAEVESGVVEPGGERRARLRGFRVVGGPATAQGAAGYASQSGVDLTYTDPVTVDGQGIAWARCEGRLFSFNVAIAAGETWDQIQGFDPMFMPGSRR